jgi:hypothetical protein
LELSSAKATGLLRKIVGLNEFISVSTRHRAGRHRFAFLYSLTADGALQKTMREKPDDVSRAQGALRSVAELALMGPPLVLNPDIFSKEPVHIYTDASASARMNKMGGLKFDPEADENVGFTVDVPEHYKALARASRVGNPIMIFELLAAQTAAHVFGADIIGRRVILHLDNSSAQSILIKAYSAGGLSGELLSDMAGKTHKAFAALNCHVYFVYVNTKFNLSDVLSRQSVMPEHLREKFSVKVLDRVEVPH